MIVYLAVFGLATGTAALAQYGRGSHSSLPRKWTIGAVLVAVLLVSVSALRWRVGTDYWTYERLFPIYADEAWASMSLFGEPGLRVIAWASMSIEPDTAFVFALASIITVGLIVRTLWRWSPAFAFSIALFILSGAWHGSFNGVRQYLACAILFAGHRYIIDRRWGRWLLVVLAATLFHVSAVVAVFFALVPSRRTSAGIQITVLALGLVGMLGTGFLMDLLAEQTGDTEIWAGSYANQEVSFLRIAFAFVPIALFWLLRNREAIAATHSWFYVNMLLVYAATYLASADSAFMARFAIFTLPFVAIGLVSVTSVPNPWERSLVRGILLCAFAAFMYVEIVNTPNLAQFQWIFQRP